METLQPATQRLIRERDAYERFPNRPRAATDGSSPRNLDVRTLDVARAGNLPRGFEGMLKTTTETGDIGMFSIKPSRLPPSFNTPRRPSGTYGDNGTPRAKQHFQPYGVPSVDDRHRLPSYTRAASDAMSMYDSSSQKSANRTFDEPDYRSYSMTQTSHSSYTLSNHKSYASLRGQQDTPHNGPPVGAGTILQRPRSPFAYPTRLRRPGFRPSSPALTDGGIVDYSRRAEIDRMAHNSGNSASTPSSLYAMKRRPPHTLRPDGHRSTPSLLSQTSPHRRSSSPQVYPTCGNDWARRNFTASSNTSPARSTFSLASTANLRASATATSVTTTPGRFPPPSPLYYDYTEDFEVDEVPPPEALPPPLFTIHKTIPEDRPMSSDSPITDTPYKNGLGISVSLSVQSPRSIESLRNREDLPRLENDIAKIERTASRSSLQVESVAGDTSNGDQEKKYFSFSGLGYGARELSNHVKEAFKLEPLSTFDVTIPQDSTRPKSENKEPAGAIICSQARYSASPSPQIDCHRTSSQPKDQKTLAKDFATETQPRRSTDLLLQQSRASSFHISHSRRNSQELVPAFSALANLHRRPLSGNMSNRPGLTGLDGSDMPSDPKTGLSGTPESTTQRSESVMTKNEVISRTPLLPTPASKDTFAPTTVPSIEEKEAETHGASYNHSPDYSSDYHYQPPSTLPDYKSIRIPNFSHRIKASSEHHDTPMLAPKPISPARQLKLKNSIPQLMKALPALPAEPVLSVDAQSDHHKFPTEQLPEQFIPVTTSNTTNTMYGRDGSLTIKSPAISISSIDGKIRSDFSHSESQKCVSTIEEEAPPSPSKLKLKLKTSNTVHPHTPLQTNARNSDDIYPWANRDTNPASVQTLQENNGRQPRFRLKLARSSMKDHQGTVRINRSSVDERPTISLSLGTPKDLFSPASGIESMFRQVSKHIHSRKTSTASTFQPDVRHPSEPSSVHLQSGNDTEHQVRSAAGHLEPPPNPLASGESGSCFSDDSSQEEGQGSLRRRLTHLKSKIPAPYASRAGTQSYDDITWKDRNVAETAIPPAARSIPDFHDNIERASPEAVKPVRRFAEKLHRQRLKAKMQGWLKGARAVFATRVKPRSATGATEAASKTPV